MWLLLVVSDSTYVVNCFRDRWYEGWLERGWLTSGKRMNDFVDQLAVAGCDPRH